MPTPKINESCYYVQHDPHKCKIKPEKFPFDILCRFGVIKESLPRRGRICPPPRLDRVKREAPVERKVKLKWKSIKGAKKKTSHRRPQCTKWFSRYSISKSGIWAGWTSPFCRFSASFSLLSMISRAQCCKTMKK